MLEQVAILAPDHYVIHVGYEDIPSYADLKKLFPTGVSELWDAKQYKLEAHESCKDADEKPSEREFWLRRFDAFLTDNEVVAAADEDGFRPATLKEALAFCRRPPLRCNFWIIVLGSFAVNRGSSIVPCIRNEFELGSGGHCDDGDEWSPVCRFLLVRK